MEGCISCGVSVPQDQALIQIKEKAKLYAQENEVTVAICKEETGYSFYKAELAITSGMQVIEILSKHS